MTHLDSQIESWIFEYFFFNVEISSALWVHIHIFEITLRDFLNYSLVKLYTRSDWWNFPNLLAKRDLARIKKVEAIENFREVDSFSISRMSLSFWTSLLTKRYHQKIWTKLEFPNAPKDEILRDNFYDKTHEILALRNLIAHHKDILNRNLIRDHAYLHELTAILDPQLEAEVQKRSRVLDLLLNARLVGSGGGI